jgi:hypothetical protein
MCLLLRLFFSLFLNIRDDFLNFFFNFFFIISINLFGINYLLLFEGIAARSMRVGVSICTPFALGLNCQVFGLTSCVPRPN